MNDKGILNILRGSVRPILAYAVIGMIGGLAFKAMNYITQDMAMSIIVALLAMGGIIIGYYFGERSQKPKA